MHEHLNAGRAREIVARQRTRQDPRRGAEARPRPPWRTYVADTTRAVYIWEHAYYPSYYLPLDAFAEGALSYPGSSSSSDEGGSKCRDAERGYELATL
ncbi:hypothetical protein EKO27_g12066, partial [Xylaria grammica]